MSCILSCRHTAPGVWDSQRPSSRPRAVWRVFYHLWEEVCREVGLSEGDGWHAAPFGHTWVGSVGAPAGWLECSCWSPVEWSDSGRSGAAPRGSRSSLWSWGGASGPRVQCRYGTTSWVPRFLSLAPLWAVGGSRWPGSRPSSGFPGSVLCSVLGSALY